MEKVPQMKTSSRPIPWYREINSKQWKTLVAASTGWMLDAMDVTLYAMIIVYIMADLQMTQTTAGLLASLTLLSSAFGGLIFGMIADKKGRTTALMISMIVFALFTALGGFSQTVTQLAIARLIVGLGMGGEWVAGAALITESWPAKHRGKAMGLVQGSWAIGYGLAAVISGLVLPTFGWRGVFFVGIIPALFAIWVRLGTDEPDIWVEKQKENVKATHKEKGSSVGKLFDKKVRRWTILGSALSICAQFGYWGLFTWIPTYLATPVAKGGAGLDLMKQTSWIVIMQVGAWLGYVIFGLLADKIGRRITFILFFALAAILVPLYGFSQDPEKLLLLGPLVAFFGSGYFSGFGAILAELFPTAIRATGQGFCYNFGRAVAASAPFSIGVLANTMGLGVAFSITSVAFGLAALLVLFFLPETKGKELA
ncbi:MFS transporter [Brevibacillus centrosporus]|uniref:MFS transporter n=1 Tax=Brevibacillus centrosporus TaxID=54910 RepID=UPI002E1C7BA8|nr:MFS transporter [Brevibacillus centrosporus]MED1950243.1 MFS transporter [Brevibacillus centrosporus]